MTKKYNVILFYKFIAIDDTDELHAEQRTLCESLGLKGRIFIGNEGINGTLEGSTGEVKKYMEALHSNPRFSDIVFKKSDSMGDSFPRLTIKVREEIVTLGAGSFDTPSQTAPTITADKLHEMYENKDDFVILDLRNNYEIVSGKFEKTVDPNLRTFRELPKILPELDNLKDKKVVAVCTGGIRCEKATCLMKERGFTNICQLKDGIHTYMEKYPGQHFKGTLYVFDNRMITDVVPISKKEIIGQCIYCEASTEQYYSDDSVRPTRKVLCCETCHKDHEEELRDPVETRKQASLGS